MRNSDSDIAAPHNNRLQLDNLQAVRFAVSLSLHFTAKRPAYKSRLKRALSDKRRSQMDTEYRHKFDCGMCNKKFQFDEKKREGRRIASYELDVCNACYSSNRDGWRADFGKKLEEHLKKIGKPFPPKNGKNLYPRQ